MYVCMYVCMYLCMYISRNECMYEETTPNKLKLLKQCGWRVYYITKVLSSNEDVRVVHEYVPTWLFRREGSSSRDSWTFYRCRGVVRFRLLVKTKM